MKMHRSTARLLAVPAASALLGGLLAALPPSASAAAPSAPSARLGTTSLAEVLTSDGNNYDRNPLDFDVVERAVHVVLTKKPGSPVAVLADGSTRVTAFVPNDRAFAILVKSLTGTRPKTEVATVKALRSLGVDTIETVLLYHVVAGATLTSDKVLAAAGKPVGTALGKSVKVIVGGKGIRLIDKDPDAMNARVLHRYLDLNRGNRQVAHGISRVLRPLDL